MNTQIYTLNITYRSVLLVVTLFVIIFSFMTPYQRGFNCSDKSIQNPFQPLIFPTKWLFFCTLFFPLALIFVTTRFLSKGIVNSVVSFKLAKYCFGFMLNLTLTELTKRTFGRLRPHAYPFCHLERYCPTGPVDMYIASFTCENHNASSIYITNTRLSFFSGHSALGSFAGTYLVCFLHESFLCRFSQFSPLKKALAIAVDIGIFVLYLYPGYTQWFIHWHFITDVLTGFTVGILIALLVFYTVNKSTHRRPSMSTAIN